MVFPVPVTVRADVSIHEPDLSTPNGSVTIFEITPAFPDRFYFGSGKHNSALMRFENKIIVVSLSIGRHHFFIIHSIDDATKTQQQHGAQVSLCLNIYDDLTT